jgi:uncharacterized protein YkwD
MSGVLSKRNFAHSLYVANKLLRSGLSMMHNSRYSVAILIAIVTVMSPPLTLLAKSPVANASESNNISAVIARSDAEVYYLNSVNNLRAERGLPPMVIDARLTASAVKKSNDMVIQKYWEHYAPNGTSFSDFIWGDSPKAIHVGENLARCFVTRNDAFKALVASPTHYAIMVGSFTNLGVSEVKDTASGCTYTTMHFSDYK